MFLEVQECIMDVNDCSWMLMHGCQWAVFALTRWCGNEHGGHNWPRCLAAFANLGHLCTCRTSSLSPSQLRLKSSCSSWFSHRKPVMVCLNWRMPQVMIRCGRFGCWKRRFWTIGCWGCSFRENSCQWDKVAQGPGLAGSKWHFFLATVQSKSCVCCWSFLSSGNAFFAKHHI